MQINSDFLPSSIFDIEDFYKGENGFYIKFKNGYMLQGRRVLFRINVALWANGTYYQDIPMGNWLVPFVSGGLYPIIINDYCEAPSAHINQLTPASSPSVELTSAGTFRVIRPDGEINPVNVQYAAVRVAFGRWK